MPKKKGGKIAAVIEIGSDMVTMLIAQNQGGNIIELDRLECFFDLEKEIATTGALPDFKRLPAGDDGLWGRAV